MQKKREEERDRLCNNTALKVKDKNTVEKKVKIEREEAASGVFDNMIDRSIKEICKISLNILQAST